MLAVGSKTCARPIVSSTSWILVPTVLGLTTVILFTSMGGKYFYSV